VRSDAQSPSRSRGLGRWHPGSPSEHEPVETGTSGARVLSQAEVKDRSPSAARGRARPVRPATFVRVGCFGLIRGGARRRRLPLVGGNKKGGSSVNMTAGSAVSMATLWAANDRDDPAATQVS
jgi:hypothetical protein